MGGCDTCGNDYPGLLEIRQGDRVGRFDSFECAIHGMARRASTAAAG